MSLSWLSTNTILLPKKKKYIKGVSQDSIVALKAAVFEAQQNYRQRKQTKFASNSSNSPISQFFSTKNKGVELRDQKDVSELRAQSFDHNSNEAQRRITERLKEKANLYNKLAQGKINPQNFVNPETGEPQYLVDFTRRKQEDENEEENIINETDVEGFLKDILEKPEKPEEPEQESENLVIFSESTNKIFNHFEKNVQSFENKSKINKIEKMRNKKRDYLSKQAEFMKKQKEKLNGE